MELSNKEILINSDSLIKDIQYEFSASYPFLKIEFFLADSPAKSSRNALLGPHILLKQLANVQPRKIDISRNRTVAELSHELQDILEVLVRVSRKSGKVWSTIS